MSSGPIIAIDFDGTLCQDDFPGIGPEVPMAFAWMRHWQAQGVRLMLWTIRSDGQPDLPPVLTEAVEWCRARGVEFWGINENLDQVSTSHKQHASVFIDDRAIGTPLLRVHSHLRAVVDWFTVGPLVNSRLALPWPWARPDNAGDRLFDWGMNDSRVWGMDKIRVMSEVQRGIWDRMRSGRTVRTAQPDQSLSS